MNLKTTSQHTNHGFSSPSLLQLQPGPVHEVSLPTATSKPSGEMARSTSSVKDVTQTAWTARTASHGSRTWQRGYAHATPQQQSKYQLSSRCTSSPSPCEAALTTPSCPVSLGRKRPNIVLLRSCQSSECNRAHSFTQQGVGTIRSPGRVGQEELAARVVHRLGRQNTGSAIVGYGSQEV